MTASRTCSAVATSCIAPLVRADGFDDAPAIDDAEGAEGAQIGADGLGDSR